MGGLGQEEARFLDAFVSLPAYSDSIEECCETKQGGDLNIGMCEAPLSAEFVAAAESGDSDAQEQLLRDMCPAARKLDPKEDGIETADEAIEWARQKLCDINKCFGYGTGLQEDAQCKDCAGAQCELMDGLFTLMWRSALPGTYRCDVDCSGAGAWSLAAWVVLLLLRL